MKGGALGGGHRVLVNRKRRVGGGAAGEQGDQRLVNHAAVGSKASTGNYRSEPSEFGLRSRPIQAA